MSAQLALGAMLLLSAGGLLRRGSWNNEDKRPPRPPVSEQQRGRGRAVRAVARVLERGPLLPSKIYEQSGVSRADVDSILADSLRRKSFYQNARGEIGLTSGFHDLLMRVLNDKFIGDDAAVRAVSLILYALPGTPLRQGYRTMISVRSPQELLEDVREFMGPDKDLSDLREMFRDHVLRRRVLDLLLLDTQKKDLLFDIEDAGRRWPGASTVPWFASALARDIKGRPWPEVEELISNLINGRLIYIYDWILSNPRPTLTGLSLRQAYEASDRWHTQEATAVAEAQVRRKKLSGNWFDCEGGVHPIQSRTVQGDLSGLHWVELTTWAELQNEANLSKGGGCLKHCIGENDTYLKRAQSGDARHFSLRAPGNRPLLTVTISHIKSRPYIEQARGIRNRTVGSAESDGGAVHAMQVAETGGLRFSSAEEYAQAEAQAIKALLDSLGLPGLMDDHELRFVKLALEKPTKQQRRR